MICLRDLREENGFDPILRENFMVSPTEVGYSLVKCQLLSS